LTIARRDQKAEGNELPGLDAEVELRQIGRAGSGPIRDTRRSDDGCAGQRANWQEKAELVRTDSARFRGSKRAVTRAARALCDSLTRKREPMFTLASGQPRDRVCLGHVAPTSEPR
jgi:hypothetical protein